MSIVKITLRAGLVLGVTAAAVLLGAAGFQRAHTPATHATTATATGPLTLAGEARTVARHKAHTSRVSMTRHARATAKRQAAARVAARVAARRAQTGSGGPGPDTPQERACVGHEDEYPCSVIEQRDVGDHYRPTRAERCPDGAATGPQCATTSTDRWARDQYGATQKFAREHPATSPRCPYGPRTTDPACG